MDAAALLPMDGPVLVFGGPYSNLEATQAVLAEARRRGIPPRRILCTGDVVAYGADARATIDLVRGAGISVVMGNCEESLAAGAADCGCGYAEGSACDAMAVEWYAHADRSLGAGERAWMAALPRRLDIELAGKRLAVVHGSVRQINRFVFASTPAAVKREELDAAGGDGVIAGHCGIPFTEAIDGRLWHNSGAIGLPANDGTPRVWYSVLAPTAGGIAVEHGALAYDHAAAAAKMRAARLPEGYAAALETGLWPSCDVLPAKELGARAAALAEGRVLWRDGASPAWPAPAAPAPVRPLDPAKFRDPALTAKGERRATVALQGLKTLWFNTGTLCNIACSHCYIESSPTNDRLAYLTLAEMQAYLDEIARDHLPTEEIGFTGGEPFMNPDMLAMLEACLARGLRVLVLTNAMRPMQRLKAKLLDLNRRLGAKLTIRVSLDHYTRELHEEERGADTWQPSLDGFKWLAANGFTIAVAGRMLWGEPDAAMRQGFARLFAEHGIALDADDRQQLVIFPEMDAAADVPEITTACWGILHVDPAAVMCASSRMVVKRQGAERPSVIACTLLPYDDAFDLGPTLAGAAGAVSLNHPHCAKFCVLGGGACSRG
jgi:pyruvate-formate lyase-activating enzyme/predicted phosphodiesterase